MEFSTYLFLFLLVTAICITSTLAIYLFKSRNEPGSKEFCALMISETIWSLAILFVTISSSTESKILWHSIRFSVVAIVPVLFLFFVFRYSNRDRLLKFKTGILFFVIPVITVVIVSIPSLRENFLLYEYKFHNSLLVESKIFYGKWFWIHTVYSYSLLLYATILIIVTAIKSFSFFSKQSILLLIGSSIPILYNVISTLEFLPVLSSMLMPVAFAIAGLFIFFAIYSYQLFDLKPIARNVLIDNMNNAMLVVDNKNRIVDLNPAMATLIGENIEKLISQPVTIFENHWNDFLKCLNDHSDHSVEIIRKCNNQTNYFDAKKSEIKNKKGIVIGKIVLLTDITIRKQNEEELRNLNATKNKFFSIIAHDLRNPFTTVRWHSELIKSGDIELSAEEKDEFMINMGNAAKRATDLLENLLHWARIQTNQINANPERITFDKLVLEVFELFAPSAKAKKIKLIYNQNKEINLIADQFMLSTVLRNLISNAIKYSHTDSEVKVEIVEKMEKLEISVTDKGVGMDKETQDGLFKINEKISTPGTNKETGTGLGLILCKEFIEKNNGEIWVESEIGKGSTFKFTI